MAETGEGGTVFTKQSSGPGALTLNTEIAALKQPQCQMSWDLGCSAQFQQDRARTDWNRAVWSFPDGNVTPVNWTKTKTCPFLGVLSTQGSRVSFAHRFTTGFMLLTWFYLLFRRLWLRRTWGCPCTRHLAFHSGHLSPQIWPGWPSVGCHLKMTSYSTPRPCPSFWGMLFIVFVRVLEVCLTVTLSQTITSPHFSNLKS